LLLRFDWRAPHGEVVDLEEESALTVHMKNPLVLLAERRRDVASDAFRLDPQGHDRRRRCLQRWDV
jgi:hypothetical protein